MKLRLAAALAALLALSPAAWAATDVSGSSFSETDASNNSSSPNGFPEGMAPSGVNDSARMVMGALKRFWDRINGTLTSGGTSTAYTLTYSTAPALVAGEKFTFIVHTASGASPTLNINAAGAKALYRANNAGTVAVASSDLQKGHVVSVIYDGSQYGVVGLPGNAGTVTSVSDATNGGVSVATGTTTPAITLAPSDLTAKAAPTTSDLVVIGDAAAGNAPKKSTIAQVRTALSGSVQQVVVKESGALGADLGSTGTTTIPLDDTIPQNTEGDLYLSQAITPSSASSTLVIDVTLVVSNSVAASVIVALFQDTTANALAAAQGRIDSGGARTTVTFRHKMTAGTTSSTTFKVRAGPQTSIGGTLTVNGSAGARELGGVSASSITITEILP